MYNANRTERQPRVLLQTYHNKCDPETLSDFWTGQIWPTDYVFTLCPYGKKHKIFSL